MGSQLLGGARRVPGAPGVRRAGALLLGALVALATLLPAAPASATTYRYWSYWHASGAGWSFANTGPGGYRPADGAVEGWRFAVSSQGGGAAPRVPPSFDQVCGRTPAKPDLKRVAVVIDDGVPADAHPGDSVPGDSPRGVCAQVPDGASGARVLSAVAGVRSDDSGLVCAIDGYPSAGCGEVVAAPRTSAPAPSRGAQPTSGGAVAPVTTSTAAASRPAGPTGTTGAGGAAAATRPTATGSAPAPTSAPSPGAPTAAPAASTAPTASTASTASSSASAAAAATPDPSPTLVLGRTEPVSHTRGVPVGFVVGLVLVGLLGVGAVVRARRGAGGE